MTPTVSVIIPCHNNEPTLSDTLESLRKQTFGDWEAIVVNDGATDNSVEVIHIYEAKDPRFKRIDQDNKGLASARNAGLAAAKGEFVNFLDADDLLLPNMLHNMVHKLGNDHSLTAAYCGWTYSDAKMRDLNWVVRPRFEGQLFEKLAHSNLFPCHSILLRGEILQNVGVFDCSLRHCHDWDLWLRVARAGCRFGCVSRPLVIYRMIPESLSHNPLTFFEAGKEVIRRGHNPDGRVRDPAGEFKQGCKCSMTEVMLEWGIRCAGFAIAQGDATRASQLFEAVLERGDPQITPKMMGAIRNTLWFAAGVPQGNWKALWPRVSQPLLQFLLKAEERLEIPGFAAQSLVQIIGWHRPMSGREHLSRLRQKIIQHVFR